MAPNDNDGVVAVVQRLAELAGLDTVYRDRYLSRAAQFLRQDLDEDGYRALRRQQKASAALPEGIRQAMAAGDWERVSELSAQLRTVQDAVEGRRPLFDLASRIYDADPVALDPFSPGLQGLAGTSARELPDLRNRALKLLSELEREDAGYAPLYGRRRRAFEGLRIGGLEEEDGSSPPASAARLQEEAAEALEKGNLGRLEEIARRLSTEEKESPQGERREKAAQERETDELLLDFPGKTRSKAARLGLVPMRAESWRGRFSHLRRYAWHPTFAEHPEGSEGGRHIPSFPFPPGTPEPLKERVALFASHLCVNSGGARLLPWLDAEDALVEDFPDPPSGEEAPSGPLLPLLGLERRHALSRRRLEGALRERGPFVLRELGLDPEDFRLVCIPADLHLRLGSGQGWGEEPLWTHFDGYMVMRDRHLRPLAGGDVRFGGIYDLVSIGMDYESAGVVARLAVIQRRRMQGW